MALFLLRFVLLLVLVVVVVHYLRRKKGPQLGSRQRGPRLNAYDVLGVSPSASEDEVKEAYHRELAKYHPDKVAHLGEELQLLARAKTTEIIEAYKSLSR